MTVPGEVRFPDGAVVPNLDVAWIHGSEAAKYNTDPDIQVYACDEHTYILRQNMAVHYEAPFMFLIFGASRALLLDTGATANPQFFPLRRTVDSIIDGWLAGHPRPGGYGLLVLHTHSHTDHTAADGQFAAHVRLSVPRTHVLARFLWSATNQVARRTGKSKADGFSASYGRADVAEESVGAFPATRSGSRLCLSQGTELRNMHVIAAHLRAAASRAYRRLSEALSRMSCVTRTSASLTCS